MATTPGGIYFEELEDSPALDISQEGTSATRVFWTAWSDRVNFARELVGTYDLVGGTPVFADPMPFPDFPNLLVSGLNIRPYMPDSPDGTSNATLATSTNTYIGGARVTAQYKTTYDQGSDSAGAPGIPDGTTLTLSGDFGAEYMTIPGRTWKWSGTSEVLPADQNPGILLPTGQYILTWDRVPAPPWSKIRELRGKLNSVAFYEAPIGTVLFLGASYSRKFQFVQNGGFWELEYRFAEESKEWSTGVKVGWNYLYKQTPVAGEHWVQIEDESGNKPYKLGDFYELFTFE